VVAEGETSGRSSLKGPGGDAQVKEEDDEDDEDEEDDRELDEEEEAFFSAGEGLAVEALVVAGSSSLIDGGKTHSGEAEITEAREGCRYWRINERTVSEMGNNRTSQWKSLRAH